MEALMTELGRLEADLHFVRGALAASDRAPLPAGLYYFWAGAVLVGFTLVDLRPQLVGPFWTVVAPLGFLISAVLGARHARTRGQMSSAEGRRHLLHWGGMMAAIALAVASPTLGVFPWESLNAVILLIVALGYFTAGVHGDRAFLWVGALMAGGYVFTTLVSGYAWTAVGVILAVALTVAGVRGGRAGEAAS
jgi:hypothetical protein